MPKDTYTLQLEEALKRILTTKRLDLAQEIAADVLDVDIEDYIEYDLEEDMPLDDYFFEE